MRDGSVAQGGVNRLGDFAVQRLTLFGKFGELSQRCGVDGD